MNWLKAWWKNKAVWLATKTTGFRVTITAMSSDAQAAVPLELTIAPAGSSVGAITLFGDTAGIFSVCLEALYQGKVTLANGKVLGAESGDPLLTKYCAFDRFENPEYSLGGTAQVAEPDFHDTIIATRLAVAVWAQTVTASELAVLLKGSTFELLVKAKTSPPPDPLMCFTLGETYRIEGAFSKFGDALFPWQSKALAALPVITKPKAVASYFEMTPGEFAANFGGTAIPDWLLVRPNGATKNLFHDPYESKWFPAVWSNSEELCKDIEPRMTEPSYTKMIFAGAKAPHTGWIWDTNPAGTMFIALKQLASMPQARIDFWFARLSSTDAQKLHGLSEMAVELLTQLLASKKFQEETDFQGGKQSFGNYAWSGSKKVDELWGDDMFPGLRTGDGVVVPAPTVGQFAKARAGFRPFLAQFAHAVASTMGLPSCCGPAISSAVQPDHSPLSWNPMAAFTTAWPPPNIEMEQIGAMGKPGSHAYAVPAIRLVFDPNAGFALPDAQLLLGTAPGSRPGPPQSPCALMAKFLPISYFVYVKHSGRVLFEIETFGAGCYGSGAASATAAESSALVAMRWPTLGDYKALHQGLAAMMSNILNGASPYVPSVWNNFVDPVATAGIQVARANSVLRAFLWQIVSTPVVSPPKNEKYVPYANGEQGSTAIHHSRYFVDTMEMLRQWAPRFAAWSQVVFDTKNLLTKPNVNIVPLNSNLQFTPMNFFGAVAAVKVRNWAREGQLFFNPKHYGSAAALALSITAPNPDSDPNMKSDIFGARARAWWPAAVHNAPGESAIPIVQVNLHVQETQLSDDWTAAALTSLALRVMAFWLVEMSYPDQVTADLWKRSSSNVMAEVEAVSPP